MPDIVWKDVLIWAAGEREPFTAGDVATEFDMKYRDAAALLERLRSRKYLAIDSFVPSERPNPGNNGGNGRRRKAYTMTAAGQDRAAWIKEKGEQ
jgi:hypothetical protein